MSWIDAVRAVHIAAGSLALASFSVPIVARKGGTLHRRAGWVYVASMATLAATAVIACAWRLLYDPAHRVQALFLAYVSVLAASSTSAGVRVLRAKQRTEAHRDPWDLGLPGLLIVAAAAIAVYGFVIQAPLLMGFAPVGLFSGIGQLRYWLRAPGTRMHWWYEHMGQMLGACIATLTAFLVVNARHIGLHSFGLVAWLAPTLVGVPVILVWTRLYAKRFEGTTPLTSAAAAPAA